MVEIESIGGCDCSIGFENLIILVLKIWFKNLVRLVVYISTPKTRKPLNRRYGLKNYFEVQETLGLEMR